MNVAPPAVRILPMDSREEFPDWSIERLQLDFFLKDLPFRSDGYLYRSAGLQARPGTIVLFQFCGKIIASAALREVEPFEKPRDETYKGSLHFDPSSIQVFDPVGKDVLTRVWPRVKSLNRVKWSLEPVAYAEFERELTHIQTAKVK